MMVCQRPNNTVYISVRTLAKYFAILVLLLSMTTSADTIIFTCKLDAKHTRGWIPNNLVISFLKFGEKAQIDYGFKPDSISVVNYGGPFKEVSAKSTMQATNGRKYGTKHQITIFKDKDITYDFSATGTSSKFIARGKCTDRIIKTTPGTFDAGGENTKGNNSNEWICGRAVSMMSGTKGWHKRSHSFYKYVVEAKNRGLTCGIGTKYSVCGFRSLKEASVCRDEIVCKRATTGNTANSWHPSGHVFYMYTAEAKRRGLSCGVVSASPTTDLNLSNNEICERASYGVKRKWLTNSSVFYKYVVEAKKRGLSCGVEVSISVQKPSTLPTCSPSYIKNSKICIDEFICTRATTLLNNKWAWYSNTHSFYKYAVEAKRRGLSCGVDSSSSKPVPIVPAKKLSKPLASLNNPLHFKHYGNIHHTPLLPNVIFFIGEIKDGNERGLRKALRNHEVDTVVLSSDGGLVGTGLELANIINDNNLSTYVPLGERCASACSFMFFAGNPKVAHGGLGVHQFYVDDDKKKMAVGKVQKGTQYLIGDIIENLEAFGTPSSVYPKMLSTSGMYFFSEEEKSDFNSNPINPELIQKMNEVLVYISKSVDNDFDDSTLNSMPTNMKNSLTQLELVRIGCMKGPVDGVKGEATMSAIKLFSSKIGSNFSSSKFSSLFRVLNGTKVGACY